MKNFIILLIVFVLVMALAGCDTEKTPEDEPNIEPEISEPVVDENAPLVEGNFYDEFGYTVTLNGETVRYYPTFMQNNSEVVYDENCNPTVIAGGALTEEEVNSREDIFFDIPTEVDPAMIMQPNTKAVYDLHGFIQNIYYEVPVGSGNYQLAPPEFDGVDDVLAEFTFGNEGSPVTLAVGGQMGDWTLSELEINADDGTGEVNSAFGTFTGSVVLDGKIVWNRMVEGAYDLIINDDEISRIPNYVAPESGKAKTRFMLNIPEDIAKNIKLDADEEMYCRVYVSEYYFVFARTEGMEKMTVTQIDVMSNTAKFSLGKDGEAKEIKAGDTFGDWKVDKVSIVGKDDLADITARFIGELTVSGYIHYNELGQYVFYVDESDWGKMPFYISDEYKEDSSVFRINFSDELNDSFKLEIGENLDCKVKISDYTFKWAPKPSTPYATVVEVIK